MPARSNRSIAELFSQLRDGDIDGRSNRSEIYINNRKQSYYHKFKCFFRGLKKCGTTPIDSIRLLQRLMHKPLSMCHLHASGKSLCDVCLNIKWYENVA